MMGSNNIPHHLMDEAQTRYTICAGTVPSTQSATKKGGWHVQIFPSAVATVEDTINEEDMIRMPAMDYQAVRELLTKDGISLVQVALEEDGAIVCGEEREIPVTDEPRWLLHPEDIPPTDVGMNLKDACQVTPGCMEACGVPPPPEKKAAGTFEVILLPERKQDRTSEGSIHSKNLKSDKVGCNQAIRAVKGTRVLKLEGNGPELTADELSQSENISSKEVGEGALKCQLCLKVFEHPDKLAKHMKKHNKDKAYSCKLCSKVFSKKKRLAKHERKHSLSGPDPGVLCEESLTTSDGLTTSTGQTGKKRYACKLCDKSYAKATLLTRHTREHTGEFPFVCDLCPKAFSSAGDLKLHRNTHVLVCQVCRMSFMSVALLNKHMRTHEDKGDPTCELCQKSFNFTSSYHKHMQKHNVGKRFFCKLCPRSFYFPSELSRHEQMHPGKVQSLTCKFCKQLCLTDIELTEHERTHPDVNPFSCLICNMSYSTYQDLLGHQKTHW